MVKRTVISADGTRRVVERDLKRRQIITGKGAVINQTRRTTDKKGRILIQGKSKSEILKEIKQENERIVNEETKTATATINLKARPQETQQAQELGTINKIKEQQTFAQRYAQQQTKARDEGFRNVIRAEPQKTTSQKLLNKAIELDYKRNVDDSLKAIPVSIGAFAVGVGEGVLGALKNDKELTKAGFGTAKEVFFPNIEQGTIYQRSGTTIGGYIAQNRVFTALGDATIKGLNLAKQTFGAKTTISTAKGTGITDITKQGKGSGMYEQYRVITRPIEEAKKSQIIIQKIETTSKTAKNIDLAKIKEIINNPNIKTKTKDLLVTTQKTKGGTIKTAIFPKDVSTTRTSITSFNLAGKQLTKPTFVTTQGVKIPNSDKTLRLIRTVEPNKPTIEQAVITRTKSISEGFKNQPNRIISQETTITKGATQTQTFGEKIVGQTSTRRTSTGYISNLLKLNQKTPQITKVPNIPTPTVARLPLTLQSATRPTTSIFSGANRFPIVGVVRGEPKINTEPQIQNPISISDSARITGQDRNSITGVKSLFEQNEILQPEQTRIARQDVTPDITRSSKTATRPVLTTITRPEVVPVLPPTFINIPINRTPPSLPLRPVFIPPSVKFSGRKGLNIGNFTSYARVKGNWLKVGTAKTRNQAFDLGKSFVLRTPSASFKVLDSKKRTVTPFTIGNMFRLSKNESGVIIEKRKYRIDTGGELSGITYKGLLNNKSKLFGKKKKKKKNKGRK